MKNKITFGNFLAFLDKKTGCGRRSKGQKQNVTQPITEPSVVVDWNYKKFGPTTFQVQLLFWVPHPHFWKIYARFPDEEFNTESIGTNLNPKNEKQKSLYVLFYLLFFILLWGHFKKTMVIPFFLTIWESVLSIKITQFNINIFEQKEKICYFICRR